MEDLADIMSGLVEGRNTFFSETLRIFPANLQPAVFVRFMMNEQSYLDILQRISQRASTTLNFTLPANFMDSVPIVATAEQIANSLTPMAQLQGHCAICQESMTSGSQIQHCSHSFHTSCIQTWFTTSSVCPVCRYDIRESASADVE